jgi:hypothetical protein
VHVTCTPSRPAAAHLDDPAILPTHRGTDAEIGVAGGHATADFEIGGEQ